MSKSSRATKKPHDRTPRKSKSGPRDDAPISIEPAPRKQVIGWREWVALPMIGIRSIKAKLDTGARSSALHAFNLQPFSQDGKYFVRFDVHPLQRNDEIHKTCVAEAVDYRWITNSGGGREKRFVIVTTLRMGTEAWPIEVTLTDRDQMGFRMLIGRTAMEHRLIIDPTVSYRLGRPRKLKTASGKESMTMAVKNSTEEE